MKNIRNVYKILKLIEKASEIKFKYKNLEKKETLRQKDKIVNIYLIKILKKKFKKIKEKIYKSIKYCIIGEINTVVYDFYEDIEWLKSKKEKIKIFNEIENKISDKLENIFSNEERYGRCVDLKSIFEKYRSIMKFTEYKEFLEDFLCVEKYNFSYFSYLKELNEYLKSFCSRAKIRKNKKIENKKQENENESIENKKQEIELRDFFDSRTFCEGCNRIIMTKMVCFHIKSKRHMKNISCNLLNIKYEEIYKLEKEIKIFTKILKDEIELSKSLCNVIEIESISNEEISDTKKFAVEKNEEIPSWLKKYYGLDITFRCEICKNKKIRGRKEFFKHFKQPEHLENLKTHNIEYCDLFYGITTFSGIEYMKTRIFLDQNIFIEEVEDEEGNVYDKKTFEDLKKMGII
ncbi:DUF3449 domain-containing protein [Hamiltosporidium tvaerminnensis]|uniref:DUF3449 domain-containing protein n=2 Tax=Hamiltosporidium TaxID=1176354 RepID=A0A4Q9LNW5_9MICR|nr:DUF3449 domain-containing protein [Hamiltosporidium tvaerminnensis]